MKDESGGQSEVSSAMNTLGSGRWNSGENSLDFCVSTQDEGISEQENGVPNHGST